MPFTFKINAEKDMIIIMENGKVVNTFNYNEPISDDIVKDEIQKIKKMLNMSPIRARA